MNVVIASLNSKYIHSSPAPWYLLGGVKKYSKHQHNVYICEATVNEEINGIAKRILNDSPDVVGFCCYIWNIKTVYALIDAIKKQSNAVIVLGGPEVSYNAVDVLKNNNVDFVVSGEGELPFALLLDAIATSNSFDIEGVCFKDNGNITISDPFISSENTPLFLIDDYCKAVNNRIAYVETTRGCPFSCAFCLSGRCGGVREFDLSLCFENILKLSNSNCKIIKFVDRTFNANKKRCKSILRFITDNYGKSIPLGTAFHFEIAGDILDDELIEIFNSAPKDAFFLEIGMQSFNEKTLSAINRKTNVEKLIKNIVALVDASNAHIHIDLIAGLPFEDFNSFSNSFNIGFSLNAHVMQLGFLKLLHGAEMRENSKKYPCEFSEEPPYEVISTPYLNSFEIDLIKACETSLERLYNSNRFKRLTNYLFNELKLSPFETLLNFGLFTGTKSRPLYEYINCIYEFFGNKCDVEVLRDLLLCDLFENVNMEKVPTLLRREDKLLNRFKHFLESGEEYQKEKGVKRRVFLLYSEQCGAFVDYRKDKINEIIKIPFSEF